MRKQLTVNLCFLGISIILSTIALLADSQVRICNTHEPCQVNQTCGCTVSASSSDARYFYFDMSLFIKGPVYVCTLTGKPMDVRMALAASKFPDGSQVSCNKSPCSLFPVTLNIDTHNMVNEVDRASFKYYVPASDMPHQVGITCA